MIYIQEGLATDATSLRDLNISDQAQWVIIDLPNAKRLLIGSIYQPPAGSINNVINKLKVALSKVKN